MRQKKAAVLPPPHGYPEWDLKCGKYYCEAVGAKITQWPQLIKDIASHCAPHDTKTPVPKGMLAVVANNPKKEDLEKWAKEHKDDFSHFADKLTGTKTSSDLISKATGVAKSKFESRSGPLGGDMDLGGVLAMDKGKDEDEKHVKGLIFFNDPNEPHKLDIEALVNIAKYTKVKFAENGKDATKILKELKR